MICLMVAALSQVGYAAVAEDTPEPWQVSAPDYSVTASSASIDVTEGTWMSVDVAPDGRHIVFDLLGDIYQIPFAGGRAESLRAGHAWEIQPQYSPDGQSIAFTSDIEGGDNIWVMDLASKTAKQITYESFRLLNSPSWHPGGEYIAARKHFTTSRSLGTGEIWMYHIAGASKEAAGVPVIERADPALQKELGEPTFAADGESLYYTLDSTPGNTFIYHQDSNGELFQIREVDLATGEITTAAGGPGGAVRPTPSPDGRYLAYIKRVRARSRLFLLDLTSGEETMLVDAMDQDMQETWAVHGLYPTMDWTPDSQQLVYWAGGKLWRIAVTGGEPVNIPFEVNDMRDIYPVPLFTVDVAPSQFPTRMVRFAQPSPDGREVVFESLGRLYVKTEDQPPRLLTRDKSTGFEFSPVWSKDGKQIYFLRWDDQRLASIHVVKRRGGPSAQLNEGKGQYSQLSLSVDGKTLVYRKGSGGSFLSPSWGQLPGIYQLDIKSRISTFVTDKGKAPYLGADDRVYVTDRQGAAGRGSSAAMTQLLSMTRDGFDERVVAQSEFAKELLLSPDGQYLAFVENQQVYVSVLPPTGKTLSIGPTGSGLPTVKLSQVGGQYLRWSPDSSAVSWSTGPELKTVLVDAQLFAVATVPDDLETGNSDVAATPNVMRINLSQWVKADMPAGQLAITGARLVTMDAAQGVIEHGTLLLEGNRIIAMGASDELSIAADIPRLDARGKTIIPGLIDIHAHGAYASGEIIPQQNWQSLAHLALGVTTVHNPSSRAAQVFAAAEYARAGLILSPRIFSTGEIVYGAKSTSWAPVDSLNDALSHVRRLKAQGAISIKNYNQPRRDQRQQVIEAARQEGLMSVAEGGSLFHLDMSFIADGITGVEHNVPTLVMYNDVTQFWRQSQSGYTPTLVVTYNGLTSEDYFYQESEVWKHPVLSRFVPPSVLQPRSVRRPMAPESDYKDDDSAAAAKVLMEAGVVVNTGGHGQREGLATHWEMWSFVRGGMSPMQALSAATINPANYMGMAADLGSLEVGKLADLVILDANPLDNIRNTDKISHVVINGRVYEGGSLQEVLTGDKALQPFWWQNRPQDQIR
jgi:imidazolonepropionase-like amidohydrolase/Tol biopolymer transport system component